MPTYAGIGSRETPENILELMRQIGEAAAKQGYILHTGGAVGADSAFEEGANRVAGAVMLFLPWKGYNDKMSPLIGPTQEAIQMAAKFHPAWERCGGGARKLHGRNSHIILGSSLCTPVKYVVCWTKEGKATGGTGLGIRIAQAYNIEVINLYYPESVARMRRFISK